MPPPPNSANDPTVQGATLLLYNGAGSGEGVSVTLPASGWRAVGGSAFRGYRYRAASSSAAVTRVTLLFDRLGVVGGGVQLTYSLDEPAQGSVALRLQLGAQRPWCVNVPAKTSGSPPSTTASDHPGKFLGQKVTIPTAVCPTAP